MYCKIVMYLLTKCKILIIFKKCTDKFNYLCSIHFSLHLLLLFKNSAVTNFNLTR